MMSPQARKKLVRFFGVWGGILTARLSEAEDRRFQFGRVLEKLMAFPSLKLSEHRLTDKFSAVGSSPVTKSVKATSHLRESSSGGNIDLFVRICDRLIMMYEYRDFNMMRTRIHRQCSNQVNIEENSSIPAPIKVIRQEHTEFALLRRKSPSSCGQWIPKRGKRGF
jgi:hypothetical protein